MSTPLLTPSDMEDEPASVVQLLTRDGLVVNLPYNARISFARYVVWHEISRLTRYDTLQTYKEHNSISRCHPRPKYECVFDIVTPKQGMVKIMHVKYCGGFVNCGTKRTYSYTQPFNFL